MVEYVTKRYVTEDRRYLKNNYKRHDDTEYILNYYLYKIEYLWLVNKIKSKNFKIYDIEFLKNKRKRVFIRKNNSNEIICIVIPRLLEIYEKVEKYYFDVCYTWKKPNGDIVDKFYCFKPYNRNAHRYYRVGDYNGYNYKLIKISKEKVVLGSHNELKYVGLVLW